MVVPLPPVLLPFSTAQWGKQVRAEVIGDESAYTPVEGALEWLRRQRVIAPALTNLESLVRSVRSEVERRVYDRRETALTGEQKENAGRTPGG